MSLDRESLVARLVRIAGRESISESVLDLSRIDAQLEEHEGHGGYDVYIYYGWGERCLSGIKLGCSGNIGVCAKSGREDQCLQIYSGDIRKDDAPKNNLRGTLRERILNLIDGEAVTEGDLNLAGLPAFASEHSHHGGYNIWVRFGDEGIMFIALSCGAFSVDQEECSHNNSGSRERDYLINIYDSGFSGE